MPSPLKQQWIVVLSTYPPRECGIATFTASLVRGLNTQLPQNVRTKVVAINRSAAQHYQYGAEVIDQVVEGDKGDFVRLADALNKNAFVAAVVVQHEFGLYGPRAGSVVVDFLRRMQKPVITVLHTVELHPADQYKKVLKQVAAASQALIAMNHTATHLLASGYDITAPSIHVIPHGIPAILPPKQSVAKKRLHIENKNVLITFGLLSPDKAIETVIHALPGVVKKFPNTVYFVVGLTHPNILARHGESYRNSLERSVLQLGMSDHVKFVNYYLSEQDILNYLAAADVYVLSPKNPNQIVSGTLAYAMGAGKAVVSTPFLHAKEMAQQGYIRLADFGDPDSFRRAICTLLADPEARHSLERKSYEVSRSSTWNNVALNYYNVFVAMNAIEQPQVAVLPVEKLYRTYGQLHPIKMEHLRRLTDDFGVIQFSHYNVPDVATGYTTDDVARALIARCMYWSVYHTQTALRSMYVYMHFLEYVTDEKGKMYNDVSFQRKVNRKRWSSDAHARAVWALAYTAATTGLPADIRKRANALLRKTMHVTRSLRFPRSISFSMIGLYWMRDKQQMVEKADRLVQRYMKHTHGDWKWFEQRLTYSNSKLPEALLYAYLLTRNTEYRRIGLEALEFLIGHTVIDNTFHPIGQSKWFERGKERSFYDQQPVEAASMVRTLLVAHRCTNDKRYVQLAFIVYQWFMGRNALRQRLYDESTGGCFDGLGATTINYNQGAESTIAHLLARLCFEKDTRIV